MPTLVHISADGGRSKTFIAVDDAGEVWRGEIKAEKSGEEYIVWRRIRSEFSDRR